MKKSTLKVDFFIILRGLLILFCFSCNPLYKQYKSLNDSKGRLYTKQLKIMKPILAKESSPVILIICWEKSLLVKNGNLHYKALIYNPSNNERKLLRTTEKNPETMVLSNDISDPKFKELSFILDNYIKSNEEYLLSLKDSFETSYPYYIYDFPKNKKLKVNAFIFDHEGKIIQ